MLAPLSETSDGVGTIRPLGSRCRRFGRDPCSLSRVASLFNVFWPWAHLRQNPGFPQHPRGDWVSASPIPVYACKIWMQTGFLSLRVHVRFPILAQSTTLRSCRPAAVQPPSSSSLQLYARVAAVVVADCFDRSLRYSTRLYATTSLAAAASAASVKCQVTCRRQV